MSPNKSMCGNHEARIVNLEKWEGRLWAILVSSVATLIVVLWDKFHVASNAVASIGGK